MSIQPLPPDVIAQIKSSSTITSLNGVIFELVKNCLDASCSKIDIVVNFSRGDCTVEDNGLGILPSEFGENGGLGKLYYSSKLNTSNPTHGAHGIFIASLSALSLLSITSHHHSHRSHNSISMHRSEVVSRQTPAPVQHHLTSFEYGTRVTVRNLFGSMPVRVKQRAIVSERRQANAKLWDGLRKDIVSLLLAWPKDVSVSIKEDGTNQQISIRRSHKTPRWRRIGCVDLFNTCSILFKASYIASDEKSSWIPVNGSTSSLAVNGAISLIPNATKNIQFLAFGIEPLISQDNCNVLYEDINRWFLNSSFGNQEETNELNEAELEKRSKDRRYKSNGYTNKELKGGRKSVDRWPMFYINIHQIDQTKHSRLQVDDVLDEKRNTLDKILELLRAIVIEFLTRNNFRPKLARGDRTKQNAATASLSNLENEAQNGSCNTHQSYGATRPCSTTLEPLSHDHRKHSQKRAKVDMLGTNVKLPSFHQSRPGFDSPFDSWSKVKAGTKHAHETFTDTTKNSNNTLLAQTSSTAESQSMTPLISKAGKLIRCPFEDIQAAISRSQTSMEKEKEPDMNADELVIWINPINKVKSLVNRRTGLVVSEKKGHRNDGKQLITNPPRRLTTPGNLHTGEKKPNEWIDDILNIWKNPVFAPAEPSIPQVSIDGLDLETQEIIHGRHHHCSQTEIEKAFKETSSGLHGRISKDVLRNAEIVSQVDKKFILANLPTIPVVGTLLVIIDQHAADERIRIEALLSEFLTPATASTIPASTSVSTSPLAKPVDFDISTKDSQLFRTYISHFSYWGIIYSLSPTATTITIRYLPPLITARLVANPNLLIHVLRTELYSYHEHPTSHPTVSLASTWIERISHIPKGILELLNSRACRSAIMFNDELGVDECKELVKRLANCKFPFMCAHGRVSMVPLGEVGMMSRAGANGINSLRTAMLNTDQNEEKRDGPFGAELRKWMKRRTNKR
ncbi:fe1c38d6-ecef-4a4c-80c6-40d535ff947a [Sclerotinia trifoliorum]|uniref:Fe1c38d6-ecef-4a4c-80c6-40d535ff947a n=1 Tax=Sclerotinia trifoliorum TaxID=28548 RepID=A0A8H2VWC6_9HELO|nr:fe1c38d6-ecef-4a4c-80c6-40d535ff947a [Sclerotinia trifoliorum]